MGLCASYKNLSEKPWGSFRQMPIDFGSGFPYARTGSPEALDRWPPRARASFLLLFSRLRSFRGFSPKTGCAFSVGLFLDNPKQRLDLLPVQFGKEQGRDQGGGNFRHGVGPPHGVYIPRQAQQIRHRQQHQQLAAQRDNG